MRVRNIILSLAATILVLAPTAASAQHGPGHGHGGAGFMTGGFGGPEGSHGLGFAERMLPRMAEQLDLSDEQLDRIQAIVDEVKPEIEGYADQLRAGRESYREEFDDPTTFDEGAFRTHLEAQHKIQVDLMVATEKAKAEIFGELTQEQRDQLEEMRSSFGRKSSRRGGGRLSNK